MSQHQVKWDWADSKVHPAVRFPSAWVGGTGTPVMIGLIDSFTPRKTTPHDPIHSLSDHNQGLVSRPAEYTVEVTTKPFGSGFLILQACQNGDRYFDIVLQPIEDYAGVTDEDDDNLGNNPSAWAPNYEVFIGCKINDMTERYAIGTTPTVTFTCQALRFQLGDSPSLQMGDGYKHRTYTDSQLGLE